MLDHRLLPRPVALSCVLAVLAACSDARGPTDVVEVPEVLQAKGGLKGKPDGKGKGGGGGGDGSGTVAEDFEKGFSQSWYATNAWWGGRRGPYVAENVSVRDGLLFLTTPAGTYEGAEIWSKDRFGPGSFEARIKASRGVGSLTAFFLYHDYDEIDIEIVRYGHGNNGSVIHFVTWRRTWSDALQDYTYRQTHVQSQPLSFDPAREFHDYRIEWGADRVRFFVDGVLSAEFEGDVPTSDMHVMASTWWPTWVPVDGPPSKDVSAEIDWIDY